MKETGSFRKRPIVVEATRWWKNGDHPEDYAGDRQGFEEGRLRTFTGAERRELGWEGSVVRYFRRPDVPGDRICEHCHCHMQAHGWIDTLEGGHIVCPGDWVITGVKGEMYPCKDEIFRATYEEVPTSGAQSRETSAPKTQEMFYPRVDLVRDLVFELTGSMVVASQVREIMDRWATKKIHGKETLCTP